MGSTLHTHSLLGIQMAQLCSSGPKKWGLLQSYNNGFDY